MRHRRKPLVEQSPDEHGALPRKLPVKDGIRDALPVVHSALFLALSSDGFHIDNMPELTWEHRCLADFRAEEWLFLMPRNGRFPCRDAVVSFPKRGKADSWRFRRWVRGLRAPIIFWGGIKGYKLLSSGHARPLRQETPVRQAARIAPPTPNRKGRHASADAHRPRI